MKVRSDKDNFRNMESSKIRPPVATKYRTPRTTSIRIVTRYMVPVLEVEVKIPDTGCTATPLISGTKSFPSPIETQRPNA